MIVSFRARSRIVRSKSYVPGWSSVVGLSDVVVTLTVTAEVENLVLGANCGFVVEVNNLILKALPLSLVSIDVKDSIGVIDLGLQAEVGCGLYKGLVTFVWIRRRSGWLT